MLTHARIGAVVSFAVAVLLAGAPPAHAYTQKGVGVVTALRGEVAVIHAPAVAARESRPPQEPLRFRDDVFFQDVIDTQRESTAKLLLKGRATFTVRELSRVEFREGVVPAEPTRTRSIVGLLRGAFRVIVQRDLRPQDELEIHTPNAISAVRGTDVLWLFEAGRTTGIVLSGLLEVFNPTQVPPPPTVVTVPQGFMVTIDGTNAPVVAPASTAFIDQLLAKLQLPLITPLSPADVERRRAQWGIALGWAGGLYGWGFGAPQGCSAVACVTSGSGVIGVSGLANAGPGCTSEEHDRILTDHSLGSRS